MHQVATLISTLVRLQKMKKCCKDHAHEWKNNNTIVSYTDPGGM